MDVNISQVLEEIARGNPGERYQWYPTPPNPTALVLLDTETSFAYFIDWPMVNGAPQGFSDVAKETLLTLIRQTSEAAV